MADLSRGSRRGQILLITAFVLAVLFVGLALVMNTVIYSENLATRADSTTSQPILHANSMETGTEAVIRYVNEHNTSQSATYSELRTALADGFDNVSRVTGRHSLRDGQVTNDRLGTDVDGTWIRQTDESRAFTDAGNAKTWTAVSGASGARTLQIFVNTPTEPNGSSAFRMEAEDSSPETWVLQIGDDEVWMRDSTGTTETCTPPGAPSANGFWVNVSAGTVGGSACDGLHFGDHLDPIQRVEIADGGNITGSYRWIANATESTVDTGQYDDTTGPFLEKGIYGTWIEIDFERESLVFRADRRVVPGEDRD